MANKQRELGIALTNCFYCGGSKDILMSRRLMSKEQAREFEKQTSGAVTSLEPCNNCEEFFNDGYVYIIVFDPEKSNFEEGKPIPLDKIYRTGQHMWIKEDALGKLFTDPKVTHLMDKYPVFMVTEEVFLDIQSKVPHQSAEDYLENKKEGNNA